MKNPTREQVKFWLSTSPSQYMSDGDNHVARTLARTYLQALDMIDRIRRVLESPCGTEQRRLVLVELAKFDDEEVKSKDE